MSDDPGLMSIGECLERWVDAWAFFDGRTMRFRRTGTLFGFPVASAEFLDRDGKIGEMCLNGRPGRTDE